MSATISETLPGIFHPAVSLDNIEPSPSNPRQHFDEIKLKELAQSIKEKGVVQPIVIRPHPKAGKKPGFQLVAGERRWRASKLAGVADIPAIERRLDDKAVLEIQVIENDQRADTHELDQANGYKRLIKDCGYDVAALALKLGKSEKFIYDRIKLLDMIPELQARFYSGEINAGHAIQFARLPEASQIEAAKQLYTVEYQEHSDKRIKVVISVRELARWIATNIQMDLSKAVFPVADADLVRQVGACIACPKRSGAEPHLWPELGKKDLCTDRHCYDRKVDAFIKQQTGHKVGMLAVSSHYSASQRPAGTIYEHDNDLKKTKDSGGKCEYAKKAIMVDGYNKGVTFDVCTSKSCKKHFSHGGRSQKSPQQAAADKARKQKADQERKFRSRVYEELCEKIDKKELNMEGPALALIADAVYDRLDHTIRKQLVKELGIIEPKKYEPGFVLKFFLGMEMVQLWKLCVRMVARRNLAVSEYSSDFTAGAEDLLLMADHYRVDHKKIRSSLGKSQTSAKSSKKAKSEEADDQEDD